MAELRGVDVLQNEIEKSKDKLRGYNENIKKLTGRDVTRPGVRRFLSGDRQSNEDGFQGRMSRGRGRLFGLARRSIMDDSGPPTKRRIVGGAFSRLGPAPNRRNEREDSPYEEELPHKLSVHSSVVATSRDAKNRDEIMQEQTKDKEGMQRNRRMFGLLLGTLNRFKTESKTLETKDVQRKKIEEKLEEKAEKERKKFKQETKLLMEEMHLEQSKISRLEQKMEMVQEHAEREAELTKLKNFIATKAKPRIFWKPVQMSTVVENKMRDSKKFVDDLLQEGKDRLDKEIVELMERETKREERIKMRLREDGLLGDGDEEEGTTSSDVNKGVSSERVVVETKDAGDSLTIRLGQEVKRGSDEEEESRKVEVEKVRKPKRTVVIEGEHKEGSGDQEEDELQEGEEEEEGEVQETEMEEGTASAKEKESERNVEIKPLQNQDRKETKKINKSDDERKDSDGEEPLSPKQTSRRNSRAVERKSSVEEKEGRKSGDKKDEDGDRSRQKDKKDGRSSSLREHHSDRNDRRDKHRNRDKSAERDRDRRKHRDEDSRRESTSDRKDKSHRDSTSDRRDKSRRDSRSERKDQKKEKKNSSRKDSSSEDERPVRIKKERDDEKKRSRSRKSDDEEDEIESALSKNKRADNNGKSSKAKGENVEKSDGEEDSSSVEN